MRIGSETKPGLLLVHHYPEVGGAERVLLLVARALGEAGWRTAALCPGGGRLARALAEQGVAHEPASFGLVERTARPWRLAGYAWNGLSVFLRVVGAIRRRKPEVVYCNSFRAALYAALPARLCGRRVVWHVHAMMRQRSSNRLAVRAVSRLCDRIVCVSEAVRSNLVRLGAPAERCAVVYNASPLEGEEAGAADLRGLREELGAAPSARMVLLAGGLTPLKGQDVFLEAVSRLDGEREALFLLAGDLVDPSEAPYREQLLRRAAGPDLQGRVRWLGLREDMGRLLDGALLLVHASRSADSLPTVILEAMERGVAVVATDVGGVPELVEHGVTGLVVPPDDADALARAVGSLLARPDEAGRMGRAGRERYEERFSWERFARGIEREVRGESQVSSLKSQGG